MTTEAMPLSGLRVVDTTDRRGALAGRLLADLGAHVILVEPPDGAHSRTAPPHAPDGSSLGFAWRNANKHGVVADLESAEGRVVLHRLIEEADVWIDGHAPAELAALGIDVAAAATDHPGLIVVGITDFGATGPYAGFHGTDAVVEAMSGMIFKAGLADRPPLLPPVPLATDIGALAGAIATLLAVEQRYRTGQGQYVDVGNLPAAAATTDWSYSNASVMKAQNQPYGETRQGGGYLYPVFGCQDGFVRMIVMSPRQWRSLVEWMGNPEEWMDPHWEQFINRLGAADVLCGVYEAFFADMKMHEICDEAQSRGIVCTPVLRPNEVLADHHFAAHGTFTPAEIAPGVDTTIVSGFFEIDGARHGFRHRAPTPGEHQDQAFPAERLGPPPPPGHHTAPLAGIHVLDFGIGGVGVEAGRLLAEYGADVTKIETRTYPDFIRVIMGTEMNPSFASSNRSKRSLGINLKTERGRELIHELVRLSDVIIENSTVGAMESVGVDYDTCHTLNPGIVMVSSQLMGSHGPNAAWKGYGPSTQPYGGILHLWDYGDGDAPCANTNIFPDHMAGRLCAFAALGGIIGRRRTGQGAHIEMAQVESVVNFLAEQLLVEALEPGASRARGNRRDDGAPWAPFPCAGDDTWCVVSVEDDGQWLALCALMGQPDWAGDSRFSTTTGRLEHATELEDRVAAWTRTQDPHGLQAACQESGIPAGLMQTGMSLQDDPHLEARGWTLDLDQPGLGAIRLEGPAFAGTLLGPPITRPTPGLGQHTREIAGSLLGLDEAEIDQLIADGVLEVDVTADPR